MATIPGLPRITGAEMSLSDVRYVGDMSADDPKDRGITNAEDITFLAANGLVGTSTLNAPVCKVNSSGERTFYTPAGDNNVARGTALATAWGALTAGDTLYFHGSSNVSSSLAVPASNVSIHGSGSGSTIIYYDSIDNGDTFTKIAIASKNDVTLGGFKIESLNQTPGWNGDGISTSSVCNRLKFSDIFIEKVVTHFNITSTCTDDEGSSFVRCYAKGAPTVGDAGFKIAEGSGYHNFSDCRAWSIPSYGYQELGGNNNFTNCRSENNAIGLYLGNGSNHLHSSWTGGSINHSTTNAITVANGSGNGFQFSGTSIYGGNIDLLGCKGIRFTSCNIDATIRVNLAQPLSGFNTFYGCNVSLATTTTIKDTSGGTLSSSSLTERAKIKVIDCVDLSTGGWWAESGVSV
jgi:hypothetical protein